MSYVICNKSSQNQLWLRKLTQVEYALISLKINYYFFIIKILFKKILLYLIYK